MFFQNTANSYVCPMLDARRRQPLFLTEELKSLLGDKLFLRLVVRVALVAFLVVLGAQLCMGVVMDNIDESIRLNESECHVLTDKNIALRAEKAYLLSPQRIEKLAAEKLDLFVAGVGQVRYVD